MMKKIILAVPKGRILEELAPLLKKIGIIPESDFFDEKSRKLTFSTNFLNLEIVKIRSFDVASFVKFGGADIGICGKDVIEEFSSSEFYSILDLKIGKCRLALAKEVDCNKNLLTLSNIRVATKYTKIAQEYFAKNGIQAEVIKLNGAIEIAPKLKLCDFIIDLVSSGKTLQENNMIEVEKILDVSSYLIANRTSLKTKNIEINQFIKMFDV
jgi:ATP phosphoribosyltransferase